MNHVTFLRQQMVQALVKHGYTNAVAITAVEQVMPSYHRMSSKNIYRELVNKAGKVAEKKQPKPRWVLVK